MSQLDPEAKVKMSQLDPEAKVKMSQLDPEAKVKMSQLDPEAKVKMSQLDPEAKVKMSQLDPEAKVKMSQAGDLEAKVTHDSSCPVVELNVGGVYYSTCMDTLRKETGSYLARMFADCNRHKAVRDTRGKFFIDRDGVLFRYILDYLRNLKLVLPENFHEKDRLRQEAEFFHLPNLVKIVNSYSTSVQRYLLHQPPLSSSSLCCPDHDKEAITGSRHLTSASSNLSSSPKPTTTTASSSTCSELALPTPAPESNNSSPARTPLSDRCPGYITVGYRGTFAFGRDGMADVKFRKLSRITICGKVSLCREVFKNTLNESRDPDRGDNDRYTSRFFLKHSFLEQAFDMLQEEGFSLVGSCGSGTNNAGDIKAGLDTEEAKWQHYNEFIFERR